MKVLFFAVASLALAGCQQVSKVEFYEPTEANKAYSQVTADGKYGHGPIMSIEGKSGAVDWSDSTTFKFNLSVLGL